MLSRRLSTTMPGLARAVAIAGLLCVIVGAPAGAGAAERFGQGLLWRVETPGAAPSHVFGTIHLADPRVVRLPPDVARALARSRSVVIETLLEAGNLQQFASRMLFDDGRDLAAVTGPELFARTVAVAGGIGLPEPILRQVKPWAAAMMLSVPPQDPAEVLDVVLTRMAMEQGKPIHPLESVDEQLSVFEGMGEADQVRMLRLAVDNFERLPSLLGRVIDGYLARDLSAIWRIREESAADSAEARQFYDAFMGRLLYDRNVRMAARAEPRIREGGAFIAVGALHLYGSRGLLAELERLGYRVVRVY